MLDKFRMGDFHFNNSNILISLLLIKNNFRVLLKTVCRITLTENFLHVCTTDTSK